ncbi:6-pyruvoyl tetrahydrobiopterin synthase-like [Stegodyphus dumicola]|uniref:6-pyruvoyl tetrahydrobiopterin synthase-like n=1 Tax=Stegodyphus dumicola TaxID=202533 RepID=UPI0015AF34AE|nr:6-pyruvoyl tetrahydrobiopterin synthase-like [Stegodyphus dumicola]
MMLGQKIFPLKLGFVITKTSVLCDDSPPRERLEQGCTILRRLTNGKHISNPTVEVTVKGKVDKDTGMVVNIADLKNVMKVSVMDTLDHKNLDKDVPFFKEVVSTTENLSIFIWKQLSSNLPRGMLYKVKVHETDKNCVTFYGEFKA